MSKIDINVELLTRVEGHGNIVVNAEEGKIKELSWKVEEAPRYFEALVKGKPHHQLAQITSRICGICSMAHQLTSLKATENAMNIEVSERDELLRRLALHGEFIQSHVLHCGYLALPDLLEVGSVIPLASSNPDELKNVIRVHRVGNELSDLVGGRNTHQRRLVLGGLSKLPSPLELRTLKSKLADSLKDLEKLVSFLKGVVSQLPDFRRETEFISLNHEKRYPLYDGNIVSSDTGTAPVEKYLSITNEYVVPQSTAKYTKHNRESYMTGALARFNNNYDHLGSEAKEVAEEFGLEPICHRPFMNNIAQVVETVHCTVDAIKIIDELLDKGLDSQGEYCQPHVDVKSGRGVGAVEAPRGILFHDYTYNKKGVCTKANCIIPTNQNHGNIQRDLEKMVPEMMDEPEEKIEHSLEMLVRAYDPCISCSTHYLDVDFVD